MIPFMEQEISKLCYSLLENFVRRDKITAGGSILNLLKVDVNDEKNLLSTKSVSIGFGATAVLAEQNVSDSKLLEFKSQCLQSYKTVWLKIKSRFSEEAVALLYQISSINPKFIVIKLGL